MPHLRFCFGPAAPPLFELRDEGLIVQGKFAEPRWREAMSSAKRLDIGKKVAHGITS